MLTAAVLVSAGAARGQTVEPGAAEARISAVEAFARICYSQVPKLQGIRNMAAQLGWLPLPSEDVAPFGEGLEAEVLEGWDVQLGDRFFRLGLVQGPVTEAMKARFPELADGLTTSCTLVLDDLEANASVAADMQDLAGKPPASEGIDDGYLVATSWAGGNDALKVFLVNKANKIGDGGVLNVTIVSGK
jgi:hypothetical protein